MGRYLIGLLLLVIFAAAASPVYAGMSDCQPVYGGGQVCGEKTQQIIVTKKVLDPKSDDTTTKGGQKQEKYVDNLGVNDNQYNPTEDIAFQITVTNTGTTSLTNVVVTDTIPQTVTSVSGDGTFDKSKNTITIKVGTLEANESRTYYVRGKVVEATRLSDKQDITCDVNQVVVNTTENVSDNASATYCIKRSAPSETKGGLKVYPTPKTKKTPPTGPEALALIPLIGSAISGFVLRKKSAQ